MKAVAVALLLVASSSSPYVIDGLTDPVQAPSWAFGTVAKG